MINIFENFFSPVVTGPPPQPIWLYSFTLVMMIFLAWLTKNYRDNIYYKRFWTYLLTGQLVLIYAWFCWAKLPLSELLPFYHCRIAMLVILFLPKGILKDYFASLGFSGAILAMVYPVIYDYPLFHVTNVFFYVGHYALLVLCQLYILQEEGPKRLTLKQTVLVTLGLNAFLVVVNQLTGGNYGFLTVTPLLNSQDLLLNYLAVSTVLAVVIVLCSQLFSSLESKIAKTVDDIS